MVRRSFEQTAFLLICMIPFSLFFFPLFILWFCRLREVFQGEDDENEEEEEDEGEYVRGGRRGSMFWRVVWFWGGAAGAMVLSIWAVSAHFWMCCGGAYAVDLAPEEF